MATQRRKTKRAEPIIDADDTDLGANLPEVQVRASSAAMLIRRLIPTIPLNDYSLPLVLYRSDLLPAADSEGRVHHQEQNAQAPRTTSTSSAPSDAVYNSSDDEMVLVDAGDGTLQLEYVIPEVTMGLPTAAELGVASIGIEYDEAYPTLVDGRPLWMQFDFEPPIAFAAFERYLRMGDIDGDGDGVRRLVDIPATLEAEGLTVGVWDIKDWYYIFYWQWRVKAYDVFRSVQKIKQQKVRAAKVVDIHYDMATSLMTKLKKFMDDEEQFWELMTPIAAVNLLREVVKMQRLSAGLPASTPEIGGSGSGSGSSSKTSDGGLHLSGAESPEELYRKIAKRSEVSRAVAEEEEIAAIEAVMSDKDSLESAQALVFKLLERPHHKERQQAVLRAPQIINDDPNQAVES